MAFNIGQAITGAISGAASGFMMGGPYGAMAGGALGGASGGFGIGGGGPSSIGGITGPGGGAKAGTEARGYYDEAFPGTNPWERLGAGNPIGQIASAGVAGKVAARNMDVQARTATSVANIQAGSAANVATIHAGGAANVAKISAVPASRSARASERRSAIESRERPRERKIKGRLADSAASQASSNRARLLIEAEKVQMEKGKAFRSPELAALAQRAVQTFDYGAKSTKEWEAHLASGWWKIYLGLGVASHTIREGADAVGKVLGARVRGVSARGNRFPSKTSVGAVKRVKPRPKQPDFATDMEVIPYVKP